MRPTAVAFAALLLACGAAAAREERFYGYAFDLASDSYLYAELHDHRYDGARWLGGRTRYVAADGVELGFKRLDFTADPYVPLYRLDLAASGYAEGIEGWTPGEARLFKRADGRAPLQQARVALQAPVAADAGFHGFLQDRFEALLRGETVAFGFIAAGRLDTYRFRARRVGDAVFEGEPAIEIVAEPDSLLRLLVQPLRLVYDPRTRRLLEYRGLSNIHDPETGKPWTVRIAYYRKPPPGVPPLPPLDD